MLDFPGLFLCRLTKQAHLCFGFLRTGDGGLNTTIGAMYQFAGRSPLIAAGI